MATNVGGVEVDLAANIAAFRADMGKASQILNGEAAKMNRSLGSIDRSFATMNAAVSAGAERITGLALRMAGAVIGFQSLGAGVRSVMSTMRDMQGQADALGMTLETGLAAGAKAAATEIDQLALSLRVRLAAAVTEYMRIFPQLRREMGMALVPDQAFDRIIQLEREIREAQEGGGLQSLVPGVAAGTRDRIERMQRERAGLLAQLRRTEGTDSVLPYEGPELTEQDKATLKATMERVAREEADALDLARAANAQKLSHALANMIDPSERIDADPEHAAFAGQDDQNFERMKDAISAQKAAISAAEQAWKHWSGTISDSITDALLKVNDLGDALRAIGLELVRAGISKFVVGGIINWAGGAMGIAGAKAAGGGVSAGSSYLVGERGPELFTPSASGTISPNSASGGRGGNVFNIDARGASVGAVQRLERMVVSLARATPSIAVNAVARANSRSGRRSR